MPDAGDTRQSSFAAGEISPLMYGRLDFAKYMSALRLCRNFFIEQHGAAINRAGSVLTKEVKDSTKKCRLWGFVFQNSQSILLEFGEQYIRFYQNGTQILNPTISAWSSLTAYVPGDYVLSSGNLYRAILKNTNILASTTSTWELIITGYVNGAVCEVATPYMQSDLFNLVFSQSGDVITITCKGYDARDLQRLVVASNIWRMVITPIGTHTAGVRSLQATTTPVSMPDYGLYLGNYYDTKPPTDGLQLMGWAVTSVDGDGKESLPSYTSDVWCLLSYVAPAGDIIKLTWTASETAHRYRIFRGVKGYWGLIDDVDADKGPTYLDMGINAPDYSQQPPQGRLPFSSVIAFPAHTFVQSGQRVSANGYTYEAVNAGFTGSIGPSTKGPAEKEASCIQNWGTELTGAISPGAYCYNHGNTYVCSIGGTINNGSADHKLPGPSGEGTGILDGPGSAVRWDFVANGDRILWKWIGNGSLPTSPNAVVDFDQRRFYAVEQQIVASQVGDYGNFDVNGVQVLDSDALSLILASPKYERIMNFLPSRALLVMTSEQEWPMTGAAGINDAITPKSVFTRPHTSLGSSQLPPIKIGNGAIFVQQMGNLVIELTFNLYTSSYSDNDLSIYAVHLFEGHTFVDWTYAKRPHSLIWAVRDDGILLGCTYNRAQEMLAWHRHDTQGLYESVCAIPEGSEHAVYTIVNRTKGDGSTHRYIERFSSRILPRLANGLVDVKKGVFLDSAVIYDNAGVLQPVIATGLGHLEGLQVFGLADGNVLGPYTVTGGQVDATADMPDGATYFIFGLQVTAQLETMNLNIVGQEGLRSNIKSVTRVSLDMVDTRGFSVGPDADHLEEWAQREVSDAFGPVSLFTGLAHIRIPARYEHDARIFIQHTDPLPVTLVGVGRETDVGGD